MADSVPRFIVIKSAYYNEGGYAYYEEKSDEFPGHVRCIEESVFSPLAKIEVEPAKIDPKFVHIRFCYNNKYWARSGEPDIQGNWWVVANSLQPEEDTSKLSCTLFEPVFNADGSLSFAHVQTGSRVEVEPNFRYGLDIPNSTLGNPNEHLTFIDWETLVKFPKNVAFKGDNGKYLKAYTVGFNLLQFSSEDGNEGYAAHEAYMHPDGHVRIKSLHYGKFWGYGILNDFIMCDSSDESGQDKKTLFWPVKIDDGTIALRSAENNNFCKRSTDSGSDDLLVAAASTIVNEAKLVVEELVLERSIYNVRYRMEDARVYDETPFLAGVGTATNHSDKESSMTVIVKYEETTSSTFSNSVSVSLGVKTSISCGVPFIAEGNIEISADVTNSLEWNKTESNTKGAEASYLAVVPPKSEVSVSYVGTRGTCNVPFSYTQQDKSSVDGQIVRNEHVDGVYTGVSYYSYHFDEPEIRPI